MKWRIAKGRAEQLTMVSLWKRPIPITTFLASSAAVLLVPFFIFTALLLWHLGAIEQEGLATRTRDSARSLSVIVERRLADMATTLRLIASNVEVATGELARLHERTQRSLAGGELFLLAVDASGQQLLNTRVPFDTPLGKTSDAATLSAALKSGRVEVSNVFFGRTSSRWVFNVVHPLQEGQDNDIAALILTQNASDLSQQLAAASLPPGWSSAVVDQAGNIVATSNPTVGSPGVALDSVIAESAASPTKATHVVIDGERMLVGSDSVSGWSWRIFVWGPELDAQKAIRGAWMRLLSGGMFLAALSGLMAYLLALNLRRSILSLQAMASEIAAGEVASPPQTGIEELTAVGRALSEASFDLSEAENKNFLVMRELAHRTKNMLAVVQSMIRQTAKQKTSVPELVSAIGERLSGLANSIDLLTAGEWTGVQIRDLIQVHLSPFLPQLDRVSTAGPDFLVRPEAVQAMGMAFHELATNAVKYGALSTIAGEVEVKWQEVESPDGTEMRMSWTERNGPRPTPGRPAGFGTTVIEKHTAAALGGSVILELREEGLYWELTAPSDRLVWRKPPSPSASGAGFRQS